LQREFGSKAVAEYIIFNGRLNAEDLRRFSKDRPSDADVQEACRKQELKLEVIRAKCRLRSSQYFEKQSRQSSLVMSMGSRYS
jgi:hypothetical protein